MLLELGIAEKKRTELTVSATELLGAIDQLTADRAQILDPKFDDKIAQLSGAVLIAVAVETQLSDENARLISSRKSTREQVSQAVRGWRTGFYLNTKNDPRVLMSELSRVIGPRTGA